MKKGFEYFCDDIENVENYEIAKADNFVLWDCHHSEEARKKMSVAWDYNKHCTEEFRKKISETFKSLRWFNNGEINIRAKERPDGFVPGRLKMK